MIGIGPWEMVILGLMCVLPLLAGLIGIGILIWYLTSKKATPPETEHEP